MMKTTKTSSKQKIRLLIVDDEAGFVAILAKRMRKRGFAVSEANSGAEAIQILRKRDFDVVVLDLKMEDIDGLEVLRIFKKMVPDLPVIMLTGHGSEEASREGLQIGAADYLTKPCELEELISKIHDVV
ncbi:MAG: response regulator [Desulfobacterales bacterium]